VLSHKPHKLQLFAKPAKISLHISEPRTEPDLHAGPGILYFTNIYPSRPSLTNPDQELVLTIDYADDQAAFVWTVLQQ